MELNLKRELARMEQMSVGQLQERYTQVFGEAVRSRNRAYLVRRIAWGLQANAEGGLTERAMRRAEELADPAYVRLTPPKRQPGSPLTPPPPTVTDRRLPPAGAAITRKYKGRTLAINILPDGFEYAGECYRTLTAVAEAITGSHCNGFRFFRLGGKA